MANKRLTNGRRKDSDDDSDSTSTSSSSDSDDSVKTVANGPTNKKQTARKTTAAPPIRGKARGRPPKRRRITAPPSDSSESDDDDPQPSTSGLNNTNRSQSDSPQEASGDSGSETPDSDYMPVDDNRKEKRKRPPVRVSPRKTAKTNSQNQANSQKTKVSKQLSKSLQNNNSPKKTQGVNQLSKSLNHPSTSKIVSFDAKHVENLAQKCVYFLLIEDQKKYAIKRKAIIQHVFKDESYNPKLYALVVTRANSILMKTFGMELMELENQKDSYLIVNILKRELGVEEYVELPRTKHQQHGLIMYLLTVIFMNGNCITEDELQKALKALNIDLTSKKIHPIFGDVKKYITIELVKQMYLNYECINKDPPQFEITWGLRAKQEFDKKDLLTFACQILDDTTPENWTTQYRDAEESATPP